MPVLYNAKKLIPVQTVGIEKEYVRGESGRFKKVQYVVTVRGTLIAYKGSPDENGVFWTTSGYPPDTTPVIAHDSDKRLALLRNKMGAIDQLFAQSGFLFEIQPFDGSLPTKFIPRVRSITYDPGNAGGLDWHTRVTYTIVMETDRIDFGTFVLSAEEEADNDINETWSIEPSDERGRTYKVSHSVSAQAKDKYNNAGTGVLEKRGWIVARDRVNTRLGFDLNTFNVLDGIPSPAHMTVTGLGSYSSIYNYIKNENIDEAGGNYSVTENWLLYDSADKYIEEYTVSTKTNAETQAVNVTVDGTITGFNTLVTPGIGDRYTNANVGWGVVEPLLATRAATYSGVTLNTTIVGKSTGRNILSGVITYNQEFTNGPNTTISGALSENITISDQLPAEVIAKHTVVLRSIGPVLQEILTITESRRTLSIEVQMSAQTISFTPSIPSTTAIVSFWTPVATYQGPYIDKHDFTWNPKSGRYSETVSWLWI